MHIATIVAKTAHFHAFQQGISQPRVNEKMKEKYYLQKFI